MKHDQTARFRRPAAQLLLGFTALASLTVVCFRLELNLATTAFAYLMVTGIRRAPEERSAHG
jgi:hypothetical protein